MFILLSLFLTSTLEAPRTPIMSERIEVRVGNNEIIQTSDIDMMAESLQKQFPNEKLSKEEWREKAKERVIDQALISSFSADMGRSIPDRDVEQRLESIQASQGIKSPEEFRKFLATQGLSYEQLRQQIRRDMEYALFLSYVRQTASRSFNDQELKAYYDTNIDKFKTNYQIEVAECLILYGPNPAESKKIAETYKKNPKLFSKCVKQNQNTATAPQGGVIGKFVRGELPVEMENLLFGLKEGEVVMVPRPNGFQILKVNEKKNLGPKSFDSSKEEIRFALGQSIMADAAKNKMAELRATKLIRVQN